MKKGNLSRVKEALLKSRNILITTHVNPDGDGISSEAALCLYLKKLGKHVVVINKDPLPEMFAFLPGVDEIHVSGQPTFDPDLIIVTDCGGLERTGLKIPGEFTPKVIVIDHHLTHDQNGEINLLDHEASATGELVYQLIKEMEKDSPAKMDYPIALCLYTSIFTDTGSFRYSNTTPKALEIASKLVAYGINSWTVAEQVYESKPYALLKLTGRFLRTLEISRKGRFAWGSIVKEDFKKTGTREEHTEGLVNYPRSIKGVEVAVFFREMYSEQIKISMRSKGEVNVAAIAEKFEGGGHHNAAGCIMKGSLKDVMKKVLRMVAESLQDEVPEEEGVEVHG